MSSTLKIDCTVQFGLSGILLAPFLATVTSVVWIELVDNAAVSSSYSTPWPRQGWRPEIGALQDAADQGGLYLAPGHEEEEEVAGAPKQPEASADSAVRLKTSGTQQQKGKNKGKRGRPAT